MMRAVLVALVFAWGILPSTAFANIEILTSNGKSVATSGGCKTRGADLVVAVGDWNSEQGARLSVFLKNFRSVLGGAVDNAPKGAPSLSLNLPIGDLTEGDVRFFDENNTAWRVHKIDAAPQSGCTIKIKGKEELTVSIECRDLTLAKRETSDVEKLLPSLKLSAPLRCRPSPM